MTCYGEKFQEILSILGSQGGVKSWSKYVNSGTSSEQQQEEQDSEFLSNVGSGYEKNQLLQLKFTHPGQKKRTILMAALICWNRFPRIVTDCT